MLEKYTNSAENIDFLQKANICKAQKQKLAANSGHF